MDPKNVRFIIPNHTQDSKLIAHVQIVDRDGMIRHGNFRFDADGLPHVYPPVSKIIDGRHYNAWYAGSQEAQKRLDQLVISAYIQQFGTLEEGK